jgi:hypothetical protein
LYPVWVAAQQKEAGVKYGFSANGVASNPVQDLKLGLGEQGIKINGWEMGLTGVGYEGQRLNEVGSSQASLVAANRLEYSRGQGLREWYVNGPVGLEQGFTLEQPWPGTARSGSEEWLSLQIGLKGANAHLSENEGEAFEITAADGTAAHYGGLYAYDAEGRELESRLELDESGQGWRLLVKVSGASYPVVVDPLVQQQELTASDGAAGDWFGWSVGLSSDGSTAIVGAYRKTIGANSLQGAAYIFTRSGGVWSQQQELTASDGAAGDFFGYSNAMGSDSNTVIVGAYRKTIGANSLQGAAYIFTRSGSVWSQQQELTASDGAANDNFGSSVGLSSDGNTSLVGAFNKTIGANTGQGAAYIFTRSGGVWTQQQELTASDGAANDNFGWSVGLSSDGNTAIVGAYDKTIGANSLQGAAYIFTRSGSVWSQQQELTASDGAASDGFGSSVGLSSDGNTGIIGAFAKKIGANGLQGAAYTFGLGTTLTLTSSPNPSTFGQSVTFTATVAPVGASGTVTFTEGATTLGTGTLSGGVATFNSNNLPVGSHVISATYGGTSSYVGSSSNTVSQVVNQASTTLTLTSTPNPSNPGQSVTFTATVPSLSATGTVTFTEGATTLGTGTLANGVATFNTTSLGAGSHDISATYGGDSNYSGSTSNTVSQVVSCNPLVVTSGGDDGSCGTLRGAIQYTTFLIVSHDVTITVLTSVIILTSELPIIQNIPNHSLILDGGCLASGGRGVPQTQLKSGPVPIGTGLQLLNHIKVKGFKITGFSSAGVVMNGSNTLSCSWVGTADGTTAAPNGGVGVSLTGSNNTVGGSTALDGVLISGNTGVGLGATGGTGNIIQNVWIGLAKDSTTALRNSGGGLKAAGGENLQLGRGNRIRS